MNFQIHHFPDYEEDLDALNLQKLLVSLGQDNNKTQL